MERNERREKILETASALFEKKGYKETKMADIAEACGIAKATMYEYFKSKEELAGNWARRFRDGYESRVEQEMVKCGTPSEKLKAIIRLNLEQIRHFAGSFLIVFEPRALFHSGELFHSERSDFLKEIASIFNYHYGLILSIIREGQERGEFRKIDPEFAAAMFLGIFLSFQRSKMDKMGLNDEKLPFKDLDIRKQSSEEWNEDMVIDYVLHGLAC